MPVIPSQSGYFWGALGQALQGLPNQYMQYQKMQNDQKAQDLRAKMLDLQTQEMQQKLAVQQRQNEALSGIQGLYEKGVTEPTQIGGPVQGPYTESGQPPAPPPPTTTRPAELKDMQRYLPALAPSQFVTGAMKSIAPGATTLHGGFDTIEEAQAAAAKAGIAPRVHQLSTGKWAVDQIAPVNPGADLYHRTFQQGKAAGLSDQAAAAAAMAELQHFNYGNSAATGAGGVAGKAGQFLGEPAAPYVGVQGSTAMPPPTPGPSSRSTPAPAGGTFPTPPSTGTGTPAQRMAQSQAEIKRKESALPEGEVTAIAQGGILDELVSKTRQSFKEDYLHPYASDIELAMRRRLGGQKVMGMEIPGAVSPGELNFRQNLRNLQNLIVYLQTGKQINENEAKRLEAAMPQPYEKSKESFDSALSNFHSLVRAIVTEHAKAAGLSRGGAANAVGAQGQGRLIQLPPGQ